jgi:hypothetical protein
VPLRDRVRTLQHMHYLPRNRGIGKTEFVENRLIPSQADRGCSRSGMRFTVRQAYLEEVFLYAFVDFRVDVC